MEEWKTLLLTQIQLRKLVLKLRGNSWSDLSKPIIRCRSSLQSLAVSNILLPKSLRGGADSTPLDLGCLKGCDKLEKLSISHQESTVQMMSAIIRGSNVLPGNLKEVELNYFILKPHQELVLLLKLPFLRKLTLGHWTDSEGCLASFFNTFTFLIKFDLTSVKSFLFFDSRRKVENRWNEVGKMQETLKNKVNVTQELSERETKLFVEKI
jgi:hypothetical protein